MFEEKIEVQEASNDATILKMETVSESSEAELSIEEKIKKNTEEINSIRNELIESKFELIFKDTTSYNNFDSYLSKMKAFVTTEIEWMQHDFITVEQVMNEINENFKTRKNNNDPIKFSYVVIESFYKLALATSGKGFREIAPRKFLLRPFDNTFSSIIQTKVNKMKELEQQNTYLYNEQEVKDEMTAKAQKEESSVNLIDIPRTLNEIKRFLSDSTEIISKIEKQISNNSEKE